MWLHQVSLQIPSSPKGQERHRNRVTTPLLQLRRNQIKAALFVDHYRISSSRKIPFEADPRDLEGIKTCVYFHKNEE